MSVDPPRLAARPVAPDFNQLLAVLRREVPERPVLFEFCVDQGHLRRLVEEGGGHWIDPERTPLDLLANWIHGFHAAGYDFATFPTWVDNFLPFMKDDREVMASRGMAHGGRITDRASFEALDWGDDHDGDFSLIEQCRDLLPEGMKLVIFSPGSVLEGMMSLTGYEDLCYMLADDPELVGELADAVGNRILGFLDRATQSDVVGAVFLPDDWGFKTQLFLPPEQMREYVFPWHRRFVALLHGRGLPVILHSCGKMDWVWDDIIDDLRYDAKHSYEDAIEPVESIYDRLADRIAIIGGIDIDFLSRESPGAVESRCRAMLERAAARGGYALGSGNSIPAYIPYDNYRAMLRAACAVPSGG